MSRKGILCLAKSSYSGRKSHLCLLLCYRVYSTSKMAEQKKKKKKPCCLYIMNKRHKRGYISSSIFLFLAHICTSRTCVNTNAVGHRSALQRSPRYLLTGWCMTTTLACYANATQRANRLQLALAVCGVAVDCRSPGPGE